MGYARGEGEWVIRKWRVSWLYRYIDRYIRIDIFFNSLRGELSESWRFLAMHSF